jgi:class 3 adenylate cyclase
MSLHEDYRGVPVLASYGPLEVEGDRWAIIAKIDQAEVFAPIRAHGRKVLAYCVGVILLVTLLASILAHIFTKPIRKLTAGARAVAGGRTDVVVQVDTNDEFRDLAVSFNAMTWSLQAKSELIEQQVRENEELLLNILPGPVAARMKGLDDAGRLTESFADVTVLFADLDGFTELAEIMRPDEAIGLLHDLVVAIDDAAERFGVEKVKTIGTSYMAVCGLSIQRPDHTNRVIDFAREILRIVRRFNLERDVQLGVKIGVNAGPVVGGVVGRTKFIYDLWGDTVNVAHAMKPLGRDDVICVTQTVRDRLRDLHEFSSLGTVDLRGKGPIPTWTVTG